jgi:hypothetical protein
LEFSTHPNGTTAGQECRETPMPVDAPATHPIHHTTQQARMLAFFGKPRIHNLPHLLRAATKLLGVAGNEAGRTTTVTKLILNQRFQKLLVHSCREIHRLAPIRLRPVLTITFKVGYPFGVVHREFVQAETVSVKEG